MFGTSPSTALSVLRQARCDMSPTMSEFGVKKIVLRDLQSLLRQTLGHRLTVKKYSSNFLLPPGENYGSTILSVHATIKRDVEEEVEEDLWLIAKMSPPTSFQQRIFDSPFTFRKETFMYEDILPAYNQLERQVGFREDEIFNILPKFYGSRLSLKSDGNFDDDAVILLENLKAKGYYTGKRNTGYDLEHSLVAIRAMARFHGLGIAMKNKKPELFEIFKKHSKCMNLSEHESEDVQALILKKIKEDPLMGRFYKRCRVLLISNDNEAAWTSAPSEPWSTIVHMDFWVNNIMFHRDASGKVDDVKFLDFQNYLFFSPLRQLIFYLFSSVDESVEENQFEELIDFYHQCLNETLIKMGCDSTPYSREKFYARLPKDASFEFVHLCIMLRLMTLDTKEVNFNYNKIESVMADYEGSQLFIERLQKVVLYFTKREWI